ncbi:MAG: sigma-70 family RNA polymerase sigma factor, partial [Peptococcaceae bacterium]|nr:sigma-70 family RNA polymerase sigma factor [Peptococcaceae bacterium]
LDIVQESAYKAMKNCNRLNSAQYVNTWLYRIVINESLSFLRRKKPAVVEWSQAEGETQDRYADLDLQRALMQLPDEEKTVVVLRFFEGLSFQQIAEILDENINTVKSRLYRSLQKLKHMLEEGGAVSCEVN